MDAWLMMRGAKGTDPSRARGFALEIAVFSRVRRLVVAALAVSTLLLVAGPVAPAAAQQQALPHMIWPAVGRITQPYGCTGFWMEPPRGNCAHFHAGTDVANKRGTPIRAAADGVVKYVGREPWYHGEDRAWVVVIDHGDGVKTLYVHLQVRVVPGIKKGKHVTQGQLIGYMGNTGRSTGPHLLFIVRLNGSATDPMPYLPSTSPPLK